ncbi:MAG TPA: hypothetical protein PKD54_14450 [Pirellulaceae bacterium]|mgnify:CR=1 FL=1|nr:hypothetical protein [Pirellulaceae bacterium]
MSVKGGRWKDHIWWAMTGFVWGFIALLASGCGGVPARYPQSGRIVFEDGSPVKTGSIEIGGGDSKWTASGDIQRDGTFVLSTVTKGDGAVPGDYQVVIRQVIVTYLPAQGGHDHGHLVHSRYRDYRTTPLTLKVERKANHAIEFVVEKQK